MLLVGGFPWAYTPKISGVERGEAWGMIGTLIFILVELPGLWVTGIAGIQMLRHWAQSSGRVQSDGP